MTRSALHRFAPLLLLATLGLALAIEPADALLVQTEDTLQAEQEVQRARAALNQARLGLAGEFSVEPGVEYGGALFDASVIPEFDLGLNVGLDVLFQYDRVNILNRQRDLLIAERRLDNQRRNDVGNALTVLAQLMRVQLAVENGQATIEERRGQLEQFQAAGASDPQIRGARLNLETAELDLQVAQRNLQDFRGQVAELGLEGTPTFDPVTFVLPEVPVEETLDYRERLLELRRVQAGTQRNSTFGVLQGVTLFGSYEGNDIEGLVRLGIDRGRPLIGAGLDYEYRLRTPDDEDPVDEWAIGVNARLVVGTATFNQFDDAERLTAEVVENLERFISEYPGRIEDLRFDVETARQRLELALGSQAANLDRQAELEARQEALPGEIDGLRAALTDVRARRDAATGDERTELDQQVREAETAVRDAENERNGVQPRAGAHRQERQPGSGHRSAALDRLRRQGRQLPRGDQQPLGHRMSYDVAIIGGGIVGLATGMKLTERHPELKLLVVEKEEGWARHQTGRNSGVIHSGIYYAPGSLKARFATAGSRSIVDFCELHDLPYEVCGKLIVATEEDELPRLEALEERGRANGLDVQRLGADEALEIEPHVRCLAALRVATTGITDYGAVARVMADLIGARGHDLRLGTAVRGLRRSAQGHVIETATGEFEARFLINCAGLHSDRIAALDGADPGARIIPFRGEYYELKPQVRHLVKHLIYPVPNPDFPFLGVHFTRMIDGSIHAGPNAVLSLKREGYRKQDIDLRDSAEVLTYLGFWRLAGRNLREGMAEMIRSFSKAAFVRSLQRMIPEITAEDIVPAEAGVRAQALTPQGKLVDDFLIVERPGALHICNAPSPAATSALEIAGAITARLPFEGTAREGWSDITADAETNPYP